MKRILFTGMLLSLSVIVIAFAVALPKNPRAIWQQPENVKLDFTWHECRAEVRIPELSIHSTLVVK